METLFIIVLCITGVLLCVLLISEVRRIEQAHDAFIVHLDMYELRGLGINKVDKE